MPSPTIRSRAPVSTVPQKKVIRQALAMLIIIY